MAIIKARIDGIPVDLDRPKPTPRPKRAYNRRVPYKSSQTERLKIQMKELEDKVVELFRQMDKSQTKTLALEILCKKLKNQLKKQHSLNLKLRAALGVYYRDVLTGDEGEEQ